MKLYVIGGKARSGKTTLGEYIKKELKENGHTPCMMHLSEPLYEYAENYFEWEKDDEKPREFLQKMGIEIITEKLHKKYFLLDRLTEDIEILSTFFDTFIITDARLVKEFITLKERFNDVVTIKVERNDFTNDLTKEEQNHITEKELDNYNDFDYIIKNSALSDLKEIAKDLVNEEEGR